eukprot:gene14066-biopygen5080
MEETARMMVSAAPDTSQGGRLRLPSTHSKVGGEELVDKLCLSRRKRLSQLESVPGGAEQVMVTQTLPLAVDLHRTSHPLWRDQAALHLVISVGGLRQERGSNPRLRRDQNLSLVP